MSSRQRKLRGGRRYHARLVREAAAFVLPVGFAPWFDLWDVHADQRGWSRRHHLSALLTLFERVQEQVQNLAMPAQVWTFIDVAQPRYDAIYVHTPNPNGDNFPYSFEGVTWGEPAPASLTSLRVPAHCELGVSRYDGLCYWLRPQP